MLKMTVLCAEMIVLALGFLHHVDGACLNDVTPTDGAGVKISEEIFECKYLQQQLPNDTHGIYTNRVHHCEQPTTDCYKTCKDILSCLDEPRGITLVNMPFDCKYLLSELAEDDNVGIYQNRHQVCNMSSTKCCNSCRIVENEVRSSTVPVSSTTNSPLPTVYTVMRTQSSVPSVYEDTCKEDCLWIADGSYGTCDWLTDSSRDVYERRFDLCSQGMAPGCQLTCYNILKSVTTASPVFTKTPEDTCKEDCLWIADGSYGACDWLTDSSRDVYDRRLTLCSQGMAPGCQLTCYNILKSMTTTVPKAFTNTQGACVDKHLMVDKHSFDCSVLRDPTSDIYIRRRTLCKTSTTLCCKTCKALSQETPIVNGVLSGIYDINLGTEVFGERIDIQSIIPNQMEDKLKSTVFVNLYRSLAERVKLNPKREKPARQQIMGQMFDRVFKK